MTAELRSAPSPVVRLPPARARYAAAPDPPGGFAALTGITKLAGLAQRDTP